MGSGFVSALQDSGSTGGKEPAVERRRPRILVVDDDEHDRELYGMMLCYNGFDVVFAGSISSGVEMARQYAPDLVLLDLGLPDGNGLELCGRLRHAVERSAEEHTSELPSRENLVCRLLLAQQDFAVRA